MGWLGQLIAAALWMVIATAAALTSLALALMALAAAGGARERPTGEKRATARMLDQDDLDEQRAARRVSPIGGW